MRKLMLIAAVVAMLGLSVAPAMADDFGDNQDADSGSVLQTFSVGGGNDNSNLCLSPQFAANTGNVQNSNSSSPNEDSLAEELIDDADFDDLNRHERDDFLDLLDDFGNEDNLDFVNQDASIEVSPSNSTSCTQSVDQTATAVG